MKKDFVNVTPDTGGGSASLTATADPNLGAQERSTTLQFSAAGGQALKSVKAVQSGIPWFFNLSSAIQGELTSAQTNVGHTLKELDFSPSGDGGDIPNVPFFQYDLEINNFNYTHRTAWWLIVNVNILKSLVDTTAGEQIYLEWNLNKGDGWEIMECQWENTFEDYQWWWNTTPNVYPNESPVANVINLRVGIANSSNQTIHTYLAQCNVNIFYSPRP